MKNRDLKKSRFFFALFEMYRFRYMKFDTISFRITPLTIHIFTNNKKRRNGYEELQSDNRKRRDHLG